MKATYYPSTEELVEVLLPYLWVEEGDDQLSTKVRDVITELKSLGYSISQEVQITGDMEKALLSLERSRNGKMPGAVYRSRRKPTTDAPSGHD